MSVWRPRDFAFLSLILLVGVICVRLGFWQLDRHEERIARNDLARARLEAQPLTLTGEEQDPEALTYRRSMAQGEFDPQHEILLRNRSMEGRAGFHVVTPLRLQDSAHAILVDRGWIPIELGEGYPPPLFPAQGLVEVTGILRGSQPEPAWSLLADPTRNPEGPPLRAWRMLNVARIQEQVPYPLLPVYLQLTAVSPSGADSPYPIGEIELSTGPHIGYAIQWFAFALIAALGGMLWFRRRLSPRRTNP